MLNISRIKQQRFFVPVIIILVLFLSLLNRGTYDLQEWDESRNGVNAFEMLKNGDYINLHYNGKPDAWNAKPPLLIWLIALSHKLFGFNEFALRFPSLLACLAFFLLCFYSIALLESRLTAFLTCLVLLCCKAILGNHVTLTADFDGPLIAFLTASVYAFLSYVEKNNKPAILLVGVFLGLAFYTKGPAALVLVPGFFLYLLFRRKTSVLKNIKLWLSVILFLLISGSWFFLLSLYGKTIEGTFYGSKTPVEIMLKNDILQRLTDPSFETAPVYDHDYFFFFEVIDARLNIWNYLFLISVILGSYSLVKNRAQLFNYINRPENRMSLFAICAIFPLALLLSLAATKNNWYLAPVYMFVAFIAIKGALVLVQKGKWAKFLIFFLFLITGIRQIYFLGSLPSDKHKFFTGNKELKNRNVVFETPISQDITLYLKWLNTHPLAADKIPADSLLEEGTILVTDKRNPLPDPSSRLFIYKNYSFSVSKANRNISR